MARESFAKKVLETLKEKAVVFPEGVTVDWLSDSLHIQTRADHKRMLNALADLKKAGKVVSVIRGVYLPAKPATSGPVEKREVMWRLLRSRKSVTVDDLIELAGVSADYATEWLQAMARHKVVKHEGQFWRLVNDPIEMPTNDRRADRLKVMRKKRRQQALAYLAHAKEALDKASKELDEIED